MKKNFLIFQIDGLSADVLKEAIEQGFMPFVRQVLEKKKYNLQKYNTGVPAVTSRFQAGVMYGKPNNVPGMIWFDKESSKFFCASIGEEVKEIEKKKGKGILEGGFSISNVFSGGAEESFSPSSFFGLGSPLFPKKFAILSIILLPFVILADLLFSLFTRSRKGEFLESIFGEFIIRKNISRILKEAVKMRVPIYVNFIGYDARSHAFGRKSRWALKALQGIDKIIREVYDLANKNYYFFILSDHGQVDCFSFDKIFGQSLANFVKEKSGKEIIDGEKIKKALIFQSIKVEREFSHSKWVRLLFRLAYGIGRLYYRDVKFQNLPYYFDENNSILIVNQGDISQIYFLEERRKLFFEEIEKLYPDFIRLLGNHYGVGTVVGLSRKGIKIINGEGEFFNKKFVVASLTKLLRMKNSGDLIILGKRVGEKVISFSSGKKSVHGGIEKEEQEVFLIYPKIFSKKLSSVKKPKDLYRFFIEFH